jgi:hypothetical protein
LEANQEVPELEHSAEVFGRLLKFVNREESIKQLVSFAAKNWRLRDAVITSKSFVVASCAGAPGIGKWIHSSVPCLFSMLSHFFF